MCLIKLEKAANVEHDLFSDYVIPEITEAENIRNIFVKTVGLIYAQQYTIFKDVSHFQHEIYFSR